jgi:hypothetical protein
MTKMLIVSFVLAMLVGAYLVYASTKSSIDFRHIEAAFAACSEGKDVAADKDAILSCLNGRKQDFAGVKNIAAYTSKGEDDFYKNTYLTVQYDQEWSTGYCWVSDEKKMYCRKASW